MRLRRSVVLAVVVVIGRPATARPSECRRSSSASRRRRARGAVRGRSPTTPPSSSSAIPETGEAREAAAGALGRPTTAPRRSVTTIRVGTPRTYASIYEPDSLRTGNIAEETSTTASTNPDYRTPAGRHTRRAVDARRDAPDRRAPGVVGAVRLVPRAQARRDHARRRAGRASAVPLAGEPKALRVVGRGKVRGRPTYVLEAERPSVPEGYREVTRIDVDRRTYLPLRYRVEIVQDLGKAGRGPRRCDGDRGHDARTGARVDEMATGWASLALPAVERRTSARQSFDASTTVTWPPTRHCTPANRPRSRRSTISAQGYPMLGGRMSGSGSGRHRHPSSAQGGQAAAPTP